MPWRDRGTGPISSYCVQFSPSHSQVSLNKVAVLPPAPPKRTTRFRAVLNTIATSERADGPTSCFCVHKSCAMEPSLSFRTSSPKLFFVIHKNRHARESVTAGCEMVGAIDLNRPGLEGELCLV